MAKEDDEFFNDRTGEGLAMGFMALGDALGGAHGGRSDFLGSYVKMKEARRKREADAKKLSPYQALQLQIKNRDFKYKKKIDQNKVAAERNTLGIKITNEITKWREMNTKRKDSGLVPLSKPQILMDMIKRYDQLGGVKPQTQKPISPKPTIGTGRVNKALPRPTIKKPITPLKPTPLESVTKSGETPTDSWLSKDLQKKPIEVEPLKEVKKEWNPKGERQADVDLVKDYYEIFDRKYEPNRLSKRDRERLDDKIKKGREFQAKALEKLEKANNNAFDNKYAQERKTINESLYKNIFQQIGGIDGDFDFSKNILIGDDDLFYVKRDENNKILFKRKIEIPGLYGPVMSKMPLWGQKLVSSASGERGFDNFKASLQSLESYSLKELSGAAVSVQEMKRFKEGVAGAGSDLVVMKFLQKLDDESKKGYQRRYNNLLTQGNIHKVVSLSDHFESSGLSVDQMYPSYDSNDQNFVPTFLESLRALNPDGKVNVYMPGKSYPVEVSIDELENDFQGDTKEEIRQFIKDWFNQKNKLSPKRN